MSPHPTHDDAAVGVVFPDDLAGRFAWSDRLGPGCLAALGCVPGALEPPRLTPPATLVLALGATGVMGAWGCVGLLRAAEAVVVLVGPEGPSAPHADGLDALLAALGTVIAVRRWEGPSDAEGLRAALHAARALGRSRPRGTAARRPGPAWAPGPWIPWSAPEPADVAGRLGHRGGRPGLWTSDGWLDLVDGSRHPGARPALARRGSVVAAPWVWGPEPDLPVRGPWGAWIGRDPFERVAWTGGRCHYDWWIGDPPRPWAPSEHAWPVGHGRKLWGFESNDPVRVELACAADAALSHYAHDVLLTGGLPQRWQRFGAVRLAVRFADPLRAVLYAHDPDEMFGDPADAMDEDGRTCAPVVALGPDAAHRYAVDLSRETWRVVGEVAERLPGRGWALFDAQHRPVGGGPERLVGGSAGALFLAHSGALSRWTPDGVVALGPCARPLLSAVPVGATPNLVLLSADGLRLV